MQPIWGHIWRRTVEKNKKCNQCDYASSRAGHLRIRFKTLERWYRGPGDGGHWPPSPDPRPQFRSIKCIADHRINRSLPPTDSFTLVGQAGKPTGQPLGTNFLRQAPPRSIPTPPGEHLSNTQCQKMLESTTYSLSDNLKSKMTGGTPKVRSDKSLSLLTSNIWHSTNGPMDQ